MKRERKKEIHLHFTLRFPPPLSLLPSLTVIGLSGLNIHIISHIISRSLSKQPAINPVHCNFTPLTLIAYLANPTHPKKPSPNPNHSKHIPRPKKDMLASPVWLESGTLSASHCPLYPQTDGQSSGLGCHCQLPNRALDIIDRIVCERDRELERDRESDRERES
eukprot:sb/3472622/